MQRRELIGIPRNVTPHGRIPTWHFPPGTTDRLVRITQLRKYTKQFDEIAWRLWWEGSDISPELVRGYALRRATRWDEQSHESHRTSPPTEQPSTGPSRDVLEEVFFQHLKAGPATTSARRQLERDIERHASVAALYMSAHELAKWPTEAAGEASYLHSNVMVDSPPLQVRKSMLTQLGATFTELIPALSDEMLQRARTVATVLLAFGADVGAVINTPHGAPSRNRESYARSLMGAQENPDEQVLTLLLATRLLVNAASTPVLPVNESFVPRETPLSFDEYRMLLRLSEKIPELETFLGADQLARLFTSSGDLATWRARLEVLALRYPELLMSPDDLGREISETALIEDPPLEDPPLDESDAEDKKPVTSKKKILNDI